ncbi:LysM peptidoglycan-binding domain-containing protein [Longimicrobium terrae]|uniref:Membrane-bound lytic murein transglycosylase D n=1 Tax=Longimicrobium terrae TaxID=1639882 RepID=A0A841H4V2_9BACT|nr:LysM peptidoglycan-binding domain-containing protein [Longimicrobium terrae]MBB4638858.1 membrane-bound lytic murein transglycosylase D [Longimicrobium terrae]MBB6073097.1 membrane-bound lytic murein transglycosylase D [Longimicrobium terrae]NNC30212.1 LysM peptidoglycan-binding domain-containing protein [Longimicrobium terrae]
MHSKTSPGLLVLVALGAAACGPGRQPVATAPVPAEAPPPAPADTVQAIGEGFTLPAERPAAVGADLLGTARYDLPVEANEWVRQEVDFLVNQRGPVVAGWMTAADRYGEWVRDVFASYGIPRDLSHLGMVESGYRPTVRSHAGAVGMWQFMPATGRGMGLRIDELVDERMDPVRSTHAAARHLRDLNRQFRGDWALAAAAYNAGTGRISRGLGRFGATNFWDLAQRGDLAEETKHYVPRLYAVTIIAKDPTRFGLPARGPQRSFGFDSIRVDLATPLSVLASVGDIPLPDLVELNPHLLRQVAPPRYWVWVPAGQGAALQPAYAASEFRQRGGYDSYRVREGDSLDRLAELSGLPAERIRQLNLSMGETVQPGQQLRLFADAARVLNERPMPRVARAETSERSSSTGRRRPRVLGDPPVPGDAEKESPARSSDAESASSRTREASTNGSSSSRRSSESSSARSSGSSSEEGSATRRASEGPAARRTESASRSSDGESSGSRASGSSATRGTTESSSSRSSEGSSSARRASSEGSSSRSSEGSSTRASESGSSTRRTSSEGSAARSSESASSRSSEGSSATRRASSEGSASRASEGASSRSTSATGERSSSSTRSSSERSSPAESGSSSAARRTESASERPSASRTEGSARSSSASSRASSETPRASGTTASRPAGRTHEVAEGETLWGIARRYDVTVAAVREANDLSESESLQPGRTLRIPRASSTASTSGETRAAAGSGSTATRPAAAGTTRSSGETRAAGTGSAGTRPSGTAAGSSSTATRSTGTASTRPAASATGSRTSARQHTVADGETLWGIARRYEITVDALRRANDLGENAAIQPGQKLTIPAS